MKMLDFAPFTVRTWKNATCVRVHFVNSILRNTLLSEHMQRDYASFSVKSNRLTSISSNKNIKLLKYFMRWPLIGCHSPHWNNAGPHLSHARSRNFALLGDIVFGYRQLRAKILSNYWLYKPNPSIPHINSWVWSKAVLNTKYFWQI